MFAGEEFVIPGTPLASYTVSRGGQNFTNMAPATFGGATPFTVTLEDISSGDLRGGAG